jgi:hypothetical protein
MVSGDPRCGTVRYAPSDEVEASLRDEHDPAVTLRQARFAGVLAVLLFVAARLIRLGSPGAFPLAGGSDIGPGTPAGLVLHPTGYDGQFVYRLALDPFTRLRTAHGITLDLPSYRQQRIMTPLLAHALAELPGLEVTVALIVINVLAVAVAVWFGTALAQDFGRAPLLGLVLAIPACMSISVGRDLTEPVAWAAALAGIYFVRRRRRVPAALVLTVAVLARETTLVIVVGLVLGEAWALARRRPPATWRAAWLLGPVVVAAGWQLWLWHVWGNLPVRTGQGENASSFPAVGVVDSLFWGVLGHRSSGLGIGLAEFVERVVLLALIVAAGWQISRRRTTASVGEGCAWVLAVLLAFSLRGWHTDVAFLRATLESWGMSVIVLMQARSGSRYPLAAAAAVTIGVGAMYVYLT